MKFEVDTGQVARTVSQLSSLIIRIDQDKKQMFENVETLDNMWAGEAHDTFKIQYLQDDTLMASLIDILEAVVDDIDQARQEYDKCEGEVRQLAESIRL